MRNRARQVRLTLLLIVLVIFGLLSTFNFQKSQNTDATSSASTSSILIVNSKPLTHVQQSSSTPSSLVVSENQSLNSFELWMENYLSSKPQNTDTAPSLALIESGLVIAKARQQQLRELIIQNPKKALARAIPLEKRRLLPITIQALLEERISATGVLATTVTLPIAADQVPQVRRTAEVNGKTYQAYVYGRRERQQLVPKAILNGIAIGSDFAVSESPLRVLSQAEITGDPTILEEAAKSSCPISKQAALGKGTLNVVEVSSRTLYICSQRHVHELNEELISQENGSSAVGEEILASGISIGAKKLLFIRIDFSDLTGEPLTETAAQTLINTTCNNYFLENSYGVTSLVGTTTSVLRMPQTSNWYKTTSGGDLTLRTDARTAATNAGYVLADYDLDIVGFKSVFAGWAGQGYVGAKGTWLNGYFDLRVTCHELGHNLGLWHANYWNTTDGTTLGTGSNQEYGDVFDIMGGSASNKMYHFNAYEKKVLGWLPDANVHTTTASGTYRIYAHDVAQLDSATKYGIKITKDATRDYWIEFRQQIVSNKWLMNGVGLRWDAWTSSNGGSQLLDTTPGSADGKNDSAIVMGRTFSDAVSGIHITPIAKNGTTPESIDVVVNIGTFSSNLAPTVTVNASASAALPDSTITLTATATDPENDTLSYLWNFADSTLSSNSATQTHSWNSTGSYDVTCTVSDMKGHTATTTTRITVSNTVPNNTVTVASTDATATEIETNTGTFTFTRTGSTQANLTVLYTLSGTASNGTDYTFLTGSVSILAGASTATLTLTGQSDSVYEGNELATLTLSNNSLYTVGSTNTASIILEDSNTAQISSGPTASPTTVLKGESISFSCSTNISNATWLWDFGDGSTSTASNTVAHTYAAAGTYTTRVSVKNSTMSSALENTVSVTVTDYTPATLTISKVMGGVNFSLTGKDSCTISGSLPGFAPKSNLNGLTLLVNIGGLETTFVLNKTRSAKSSIGTFSMRLPSKSGQSAVWTLSLKGSLKSAWLDEGMSPNLTVTKGLKLSLPTSFIIGTTKYQTVVDVQYLGKALKTGSFKK